MRVSITLLDYCYEEETDITTLDYCCQGGNLCVTITILDYCYGEGTVCVNIAMSYRC
jgi:hypothetical protein